MTEYDQISRSYCKFTENNRALRNWINHPKEMISPIRMVGNSTGQMTWFLEKIPGRKKSLMLFEITRKSNFAWMY